MKIQYCSDLHLEFPANENFLKENPIIPTGEILILAGDIMLFSKMNNYSEFFDYLSKNFKAVYWLPGNHEYYHSDMKYRIGPFREEIRHNIFVLNDTVEIIDGVRFIFSTLWSYMGKKVEDEIWRSLNDFRLILIDRKKFDTDIYNTLHREAIRFHSESLKQKHDGKTVIVTHHVPTLLNYPEQYLGDMLNNAFATELKSLIEEFQPDYWIYAHHHANIPAFNIGKTTMLTNQMGYVYAKEHLKFNQTAIFLVETQKK